MNKDDLKIGDKVSIIDYSNWVPTEYIGKVSKVIGDQVVINIDKFKTRAVDTSNAVITTCNCSEAEVIKNASIAAHDKLCEEDKICGINADVVINDCSDWKKQKHYGCVIFNDGHTFIVRAGDKNWRFLCDTLTNEDHTAYIEINWLKYVWKRFKQDICFYAKIQALVPLFVFAKLYFLIDISWWIVLIPFWSVVSLGVLVFIAVVASGLYSTWKNRN